MKICSCENVALLKNTTCVAPCTATLQVKSPFGDTSVQSKHLFVLKNEICQVWDFVFRHCVSH